MTNKRKILLEAQQHQRDRTKYNQQVRSAAREVIDGQETRPVMVAVNELIPNPSQPRTVFDDERLRELAATIKEQGVLQPILIRIDGGQQIIIAGERRWRAAKLAGLKEIPAILKQGGDPRALALIENVQREDLNPVDLAISLKALKDQHGYSDGKLGEVLGKSRTRVNEILVINRLPSVILRGCRTSDTPLDAILQIARQPNPKAMMNTWEAMKAGGLKTVKEARSLRAKKGTERPQGYVYRSKGEGYTLSVSFASPKAEKKHIGQVLLREAKKAMNQ